jgi:pantothenate kinase
MADPDLDLGALLEAADCAVERFFLGVTGPPGAGKSTVAASTAAAANEARGPGFAIVAPMDGFHLSNEQLDGLGLLAVKGAPETFDVDGFVRLLEQARRDRSFTVLWPGFDRSIEQTVPGAIRIVPATGLVIVEGNYLLLDRPRWRDVRALLDEVWYVNAPRSVLRQRLLERALEGGRTEAEALHHVESSDLPNADLVAASKAAADRVIENGARSAGHF